jgi:NAD(P)-dependent dehydrogenase (short-subunit alcohol dehydrogenase family)
LYCSSKFGAVGFTSALAIDMKPHNVAVNSICPGAADTPLTAYSKPDVDKSDWLKPEDIANLTAFIMIFTPSFSTTGRVNTNSFTCVRAKAIEKVRFVTSGGDFEEPTGFWAKGFYKALRCHPG